MGRKNKGKQVLTDSNSVRFFWITRTFAVVRETADRAPPTPEGHRLPEFCREHARSRLWQRRSARLSLETSISNRKGRSCCLYPDTGETYASLCRLKTFRDQQKTIKVTCDRCQQIVEGIRGEEFSAGFYDMIKWEEYRRDNERYVCESCMFADPRYIERYGSCF